MRRKPNIQDTTWFLDIQKSSQLDLEPPYQRKSVWTLKDRQFFLDTVFRNFPCPPIFLHKSLDDLGNATYHVVDGKQRLESIISFVNNEFKLDKNFGDTNLDGKKWEEISTDYKKKLWNYELTVEYMDDITDTTVNEVFDRVNRNQKKLERQELRHAKYSGWLVTEAEKEASEPEWKSYGIGTTANVKRMKDVQFISELMLILLEGEVKGFDQDTLDAKYAEYDDPQLANSEFDEEEYRSDIRKVKSILDKLQERSLISKYARSFTNFYTLWSLIALHPEDLPSVDELATKYESFMQQVKDVSKDATDQSNHHAVSYAVNMTGANTDLKQRSSRLQALRAAIVV